MIGRNAFREIKRRLPQSVKRNLRYVYLEQSRRLGFKPSPSLKGLDSAVFSVLPHLKEAPGFFIEAGANDGISQSNTYVLERDCGWQGLLVEPVPHLANLAERYRKSEVLRVALGSKDSEGGEVVLEHDNLRTHVASGQHGNQIKSPVVVPLVSLSSLLREREVSQVDFFSLDVDGYENEVLSGFDYAACSIECLLVETKRIDLLNIPIDYFREPVKLSHHDYLLVRNK